MVLKETKISFENNYRTYDKSIEIMKNNSDQRKKKWNTKLKA